MLRMSTATESYHTTEGQAPFLRIETPRERLALPYSTLLALMLSADETTLELDFASRVVTVKGKRLYEVFCVLAAGRGEGIFARSASDEMTLSRANRAPFISEIRIKEIASGGG